MCKGPEKGPSLVWNWRQLVNEEVRGRGKMGVSEGLAVIRSMFLV